MTVRSPFVQSGVDTAESVRLGLSLMVASTGAAVLDRRSGIVPYVGACDLTGVSPMVGRISPFVAWVDGTSGTNQGGYPVVVDANVDVTFDSGEAGNTRIDRVVLQIRDDPYDASTFQDARVVIVKGQAGGAANAVPASSLLLWEVTVPTGASVGGGGFTMSSARADKRTYTAALGGMIPVKDSAEEAALTASEGDRVFRLDAGDPRLYRGGAWTWDAPKRFIRKSADTSRTSTTSLANDIASGAGFALSLPVVANASYQLSGMLYYSTRSDTDIKVKWSLPSGFMEWRGDGLASSATGTAGDVAFERLILGTTANYGGAGAENSTILGIALNGNVVISSTPGSMILQWAQVTTNATATILRGESFFALERVG